MNLDNELQLLDAFSKEELISYAKQFNIFKVIEEPNYLAVKNKIISLMSKHNLSEVDIMPNPRILVGDLHVRKVK